MLSRLILASFVVCIFICFFFNYTATTEIYTYRHTLSLHDALPIFPTLCIFCLGPALKMSDTPPEMVRPCGSRRCAPASNVVSGARSEEHTSELQSLMRISYAVFCLKKKKYKILM